MNNYKKIQYVWLAFVLMLATVLIHHPSSEFSNFLFICVDFMGCVICLFVHQLFLKTNIYFIDEILT